MEYRTFTLVKDPTVGDGLIHVVRIDPALAQLDLGLRSVDGAAHTAAEWATRRHFAVVINAGMYQADLSTHTGYLRHDKHLNNPAWTKSYQSVLLINPADPGRGRARLVDRDDPAERSAIERASSVVQNLRLIKTPGLNVWKPNSRKWSEALVASDREGRVLFLFMRTPLEMAALNDELLALPLGLTHAMHVEGGPEASLSIHAGGVDLDLCGSYETGFVEDDSNGRQWDLPAVLGVVSRTPRPAATSTP